MKGQYLTGQSRHLRSKLHPSVTLTDRRRPSPRRSPGEEGSTGVEEGKVQEEPRVGEGTHERGLGGEMRRREGEEGRLGR